MENMAASARVFATTELLESILLQAPTRTLLLSQRVDKTWQATISGSTKLQQALFFMPLDRGCYTEVAATIQYGNTVTNPLLQPLIQHLRTTLYHPSDLEKLDKIPPPHRMEQWRHENASWRRMLSTQPLLYPTFTIILNIDVIGNPDRIEYEYVALEHYYCFKSTMGLAVEQLRSIFCDKLQRIHGHSWVEVKTDVVLEQGEEGSVGNRLEGMVAHSKSAGVKSISAEEWDLRYRGI